MLYFKSRSLYWFDPNFCSLSDMTLNRSLFNVWPMCQVVGGRGGEGGRVQFNHNVLAHSLELRCK